MKDGGALGQSRTAVQGAPLYEQSHCLTGGMEAWHHAGLPVASERNTPEDPETPSGAGASGDAERP